MGPGGLMVVNIIVNYCCTGALLYAKVLKVTENEEKRLACQIFFIDGISIRWVGVGTRASSPPGYAYDCNFNAIRDIKILCAFFACLTAKAILMVLFCIIMLNM